jgi:restriction system protein
LKKRARRQLEGWGAVAAVAAAVWVGGHWTVV